MNTQMWRFLASDNLAKTLTGTTTETKLASVKLPGGLLGRNGRLRITALWTYTNSANSKNLRIRLGGTSGTAFLSATATTTAIQRTLTEIVNRNSEASQVGTSVSGYVASTTSLLTSSINTATEQEIAITGQLTNTGETLKLEGYLIEILVP